MAYEFSLQRGMRGLAYIVFLFVCFGGVTPHAQAALLYFEPDAIELHRGDTAVVALRLDTDENECVNTVSAVVHYDPSVRAVDISTGNSILNVWVEEPVIDEERKTISFAAGVPGGYCGRIPGDPALTNVLLEIMFRSPGLQIGGGDEANTARIWVDESAQALLHDGFATPAPLRTQESVITLLPTANAAPEDPWRETVLNDSEPPADFSITLTQDPSAFSNKYFIVFNTTDKQSGIDHYEVMEEPFKEFASFTWGRGNAPWRVAESPYVLEDQTLNSTILVKAIDKAGNERLVRLVPDVAVRGISHNTLMLIFGGAAVLFVIGVVGAYLLWRRSVRQSIE